MTACKDSQATSGKKAVSATLAGVLAVGLVPAVALADEAVEVTEEDGITERVVDAAAAFSEGKVTEASLDGAAAAAVPSTGLAAVAYDGEAVTCVPTKVTLRAVDGTAVVVDVTTADYQVVYYKADSNGKPTGSPLAGAPSAIGKYCAAVKAVAGNYKGGETSVAFSIAASQFTAVKFGTVNDAGAFTAIAAAGVPYTAQALSGVFQNNGADILVEGKDCTVEWYVQGADVSSNVRLPGAPVNAGTYTAKLTGLGAFAGSDFLVENIKIKQLDLSTDASFEDITTASSSQPVHPTAVTIGGVRYTDSALLSQITLSNAQGTGTNNFYKNGAYTFDAKAADDNENITGTGTVDVNKVAAMATINYDGSPMQGSVNIKAGDWSEADIKVFAPGSTTAIAQSATTYTVAYTDLAGNAKTAADVNNGGQFIVTVSVVPSWTTGDSTFELGGTATMQVNSSKGTVNANANVFVTYDGEAMSSITTPYVAGGNVIDDIEVTVYADDDATTPLPPTAYTVTYTDAAGNEVSTIENAGTYTLTVTSEAYNITGTNTVKITVLPVVIDNLKVTGTSIETTAFTATGAVNYSWINTTNAVTLTNLDVKYVPADAEPPTPVAIPAGVNVVWQMWDADGSEWVNVTEAAEDSTNKYRVTLQAQEGTAAADNYVLSGKLELGAAPTSSVTFLDVHPGEWFFGVVEQAAADNFLNGYAGTELFGPNDNITRGQVACVLFNMAKANAVDWGDMDKWDHGIGWNSFSDVEDTMYYAAAIAWAKDAGVVHGYAGTNDFGPNNTVTREEFAAMLANYASKVGSTLPSGANEIDALLVDKADGKEVSGWARQSVAWAVQNKVMGNGGFIAPFSNTTRAETAAMVVNYDNSVK